MTSFNYYDQNPSGFFFLVRIKALGFFNLADIGIILKQFYPLLFRFHHIALTELLWFIFRAILRPRLLLKLGMYHRQLQLYLTKKGTRPSAVRHRLCYS